MGIQPGRTAKSKRSLKSLNPKSILDRSALIEALEDQNIPFKSIHIDTLYQSLHRLHYPPLPEFIQHYRRLHNNEDEAVVKDDDDTTATTAQLKPLRNAVASRKNTKVRAQLPTKLQHFLSDPASGFVTISSTVVRTKSSADGTTTKLAVQLVDGQLVESVLMRYISPTGSRASLCVSSQCGCAMGCTFCATGTMGLFGNLTTGEILEQIVHADGILATEWQERQQGKENKGLNLDFVRNVVFMGMGEPLDNYNNVVDACRALMDQKRWNLAYGRITISTVGLVSKIRQLTKELPQVSLAVSLHAPNQKMRSAIVPSAKNFPIEDLIDALDSHLTASFPPRRQPRSDKGNTILGDNAAQQQQAMTPENPKYRRAMIEYVMLEGDTSTLECAHQLGKLCENRNLLVNLIPYNVTDVRDRLHCPSPAHMEEFKRIVASYGVFVTIRRTMGADIDSACGQLITLEEKNQKKDQIVTLNVPDIEDAAAGLTNAASTTKKSFKKVERLETMPAPLATNNTVSTEESALDRWVRPLATATAIATSCFLITTFLFLRQQHQKRR